MTSNLAGFVTTLAGDRGEALAHQFERFPEMTYVALAKPAAPEAAELEAQYRRLAAQDPSFAPVAAELLSLVVRDLADIGGRDFLGGVIVARGTRA